MTSSLLDYANAKKAFHDKDWDKARALLKKPSNENAPQQRTIGSLIQVELASGNLEEAERLSYILEDQYPNDINTLIARASIYDAQGGKKKGDEFLQKKWEENHTPRLAQVIYNRLEIEPTEQSRFLSLWNNAEPDNYKPLTYLALKAQRNNDKTKAIAYYEKALILRPNSPTLLNNLAWLYYQAKNPLALDTAKRAYELTPENAAILDTYGWILVVNGHKEAGIEFLEKASIMATPSELKEIEAHLDAAKKT
jgi:tetratricopeptide (TPR) repeat protein